MELRLQKLIESLVQISSERGVSENNPVVTRVSSPAAGALNVVVISFEEPTTLVLPINVIWITTNPVSDYYHRARRRVSKVDPGTGGHTWETITRYDDAFVTQTYDAADEAIITAGPSAALATDAQSGLVRLSIPPAVAGDPVVVGENDPRLTDARNPTPHTHPQQPATALQTTAGNVVISTSGAPSVGSVLIATSTTEATWRPLTQSDIQA